jgi:hypothetical protein
MAIRSGIGIGEAQIYDSSGLVNTYGKVLAQQAKDRAKFEEDLATTMAKYSTKGLKDGDIKLTTEAYKTLKDKVTKYDSSNPTQRAQALAEARAGMQAIQDYADGAMTAYSTLDKIGGDILENSWKYKPEAVTAIKQLYANPYATWSDDYKDLNKAKFEKEVDGSSVQKLFNSVNADLKGQAEAGNQFKVGEKGGYKVATYFATPEQASQTILKSMDLAPEAKYTLNKAYELANPDKKDYTQADVANFATKLYSEQFGPNALNFKGSMNLKPTGGSGDNASNPANYEVIMNKTFTTSPTYDKSGKLISNGKPIITFDKFVTSPVNQPFATPQIGNAFNLTDGKSESIGSKKGLRITGMGVKNGNLRVTVVDDDEIEYYLKPEDIPLIIRNGNQYKAAKKALGSAKSSGFDIDAYLQKKGLK